MAMACPIIWILILMATVLGMLSKVWQILIMTVLQTI